MNKNYDVAIVGAGFTGLVAAYELTKKNIKVIVIESDKNPGGLAGTFEFSKNIRLEKFYHHWFNNDVYIQSLIEEFGLKHKIMRVKSKTGMFFNKRIWNLSTPLDLLRFKPLSFINRIKLGLLVFKVRKFKDWKLIEHLSIRQWLESLVGKKIYNIVWAPLVNSKFSIFSEKISAVWMWKKLHLRGSTRSKDGNEELLYFQGGFNEIAEKLHKLIISNGGEVLYNSKVSKLEYDRISINKIILDNGMSIEAKKYLLTPAFKIIHTFFKNKDVSNKTKTWLNNIKKIDYLGNVCLVLRLNKSLSSTYWLNVNDPGFPFVGVIEHTNFDHKSNYANSHIVYLSKYLPVSDDTYSYSSKKYFEYAFPYLNKMFPELKKTDILEYKVWKAEFAQPVTLINYSKYLPSHTTPFANLYIYTMAQIYPEDRGTNYAVRDGKKAAIKILKSLE